jgi:Protein of unknown function (DUF4058)
MPALPIPLDLCQSEPVLALPEVFNGVYDRAGFDLVIDYHQPVPKPAWSEADQAWVKELVKGSLNC